MFSGGIKRDHWHEMGYAGFPLVDFFCTNRLFSWQKSFIMKNMKNMPQIKSEAFVQRCPVNKMFLDISQNSHENTCAVVSV